MIKRLLARKSLAAWCIERIAVLTNDFHLSSPADVQDRQFAEDTPRLG